MHAIDSFNQFSLINEARSQETFEEFAQTRLAGATKIAEGAKQKGGDSLLTYEHFRVKLPYYKKAAAGKFELKAAQAELSQLMSRLDDGTDKMVSLKQKDFQQLVGKIEVLGELIIRWNYSN